MDPREKTVKDAFDRALEIASPEERRAFLDEACGDEADLRSQVDALLRAHDQAGSFLEAPARPEVTVDEEGGSAGSNSSVEDLSPGTLIGTGIGPYKLLQQIGSGGMGTVYMAEQIEPVRRRVALKVINPGMDSRQVIARFEAERQALAMMDHQNIARVLDAGTTLGRPYFVMELIKGVPIVEYCDQNRLNVRER